MRNPLFVHSLPIFCGVFNVVFTLYTTPIGKGINDDDRNDNYIAISLCILPVGNEILLGNASL